jgi:outer membrane protein OmpA-like peptidoglycan-associated protein
MNSRVARTSPFNRLPRFLLLATAAATLAACAGLPDRNVALDDARTKYHAVQAQPQVRRYATEELAAASTALQRTEKAHADRDSETEVTHLAYLTTQRVAIAQETASARAAQDVTAGAAAERDRMRLTLRTQEADATQRQLTASERAGARKSAELAQAGQSAAEDQARLARRDARVDTLEQQLVELNAQRTDRGIVVTLGDLLFDSGRSQLQADSTRSIGKLADFMKRNPQRRAAVDGYTDSVGSATSNQLLSDRRAQAVMDALVELGVGAERLSARGYGEGQPVAGNESAAGRQMNRRVEVVFAPEAGDILTR